MSAARRRWVLVVGTQSGGGNGARQDRLGRASAGGALSGRTIGLVALLAALLCGLGPAASARAVTGTDPITTIAGTGVGGSFGDGFSATKAMLKFPFAVAVDRAGNLYVDDYSGFRVRKVDTSGVITTVAGNGSPKFSGDGGPATQAGMTYPDGIGVDASGNLYISSFNNFRVRKVDSATGIITTVAGNGSFGSSGDGGPATQAAVTPCALAVDGAGNLYIGDCFNNLVRKVDAATGIITTVAGNGSSGCDMTQGVPATQTSVDAEGLAVDGSGQIYIAETSCELVRKVDAAGIITTVAGNGTYGYGGDGGPATQAELSAPTSAAVDSAGSVYIADLGNSRVRKVDGSGIISTVAGNGGVGHGGDFGPANQAQIDPWGVALDSAGGLYIADGDLNHRVRRVGPDRLFPAESHAPDPATQGDRITYTFTVHNLAVDTSTGVKLTDTLPANVAFIGNSPGCSLAGLTVTCLVGSIAPGASAAATITVQALHPGALTNTATVSSDQPEPYPPTNIVVSPTLVSARNCGEVITRNTVLGGDLGPCAQSGIVIGADNVTLDLKGRRIYGFPGPSGPAGNSAGVVITGRKGVTVTNGTVTEFDAGVVITGGGSNTLTGLTIKDNIGPDDPFNSLYGDGVFIQQGSTDNHVVGNIIDHNGIFDGIGIYDPGSDANVIENNVIENTVGSSDGGPDGEGVIINGAAGGLAPTSISSTRVANNTIRANASGGIANLNHVNGSILSNTIIGNGVSNYAGNGIGVQVGFSWNRSVPVQMLIQGNQIHANAWNGIQIRNRAHGNQILNNNAADNGANPAANSNQAGFDLVDLNSGGTCDSNTWYGNIWGSAGYNPPCTATGGSLSTAPPSAAPSTAPASPVEGLWKRQNANAWQDLIDHGR